MSCQDAERMSVERISVAALSCILSRVSTCGLALSEVQRFWRQLWRLDERAYLERVSKLCIGLK